MIKTWHVELLIVAAILSVVAVVTHGGLTEWIGAGAVTLSFAHAQVADRLAEYDAARPTPSVNCHSWAARYLVGKESLWFLYFVLHHSWSALVGVGLFLAYPIWRRTWRQRHVLQSNHE